MIWKFDWLILTLSLKPSTSKIRWVLQSSNLNQYLTISYLIPPLLTVGSYYTIDRTVLPYTAIHLIISHPLLKYAKTSYFVSFLSLSKIVLNHRKNLRDGVTRAVTRHRSGRRSFAIETTNRSDSPSIQHRVVVFHGFR